MARLTWLADELREAGLTVVEVDGWKTRGSSSFDPVGMTWHATAGSRKGTALSEVNVILNGSETAPPPIAQLMLWRDGVIYVCAAGRCNHNKVGWAGPNKGLGNTKLLGIEMANDNRGEPWPDVQLDAARRATAAIMRRFGADPMKRLAAHYEHQPAAGKPAGETSTKTDPLGVVMTQERPRVAAIMRGDDMPLTDADLDKIEARLRPLIDAVPKATLDLDTVPNYGDDAATNPTTSVRWAVGRGAIASVVAYQVRAKVDALAAVLGHVAENVVQDDGDLDEIRAAITAARTGTVADLLAALGGASLTAEQVAAALRAALGDRAAEVGRLLAAA